MSRPTALVTGASAGIGVAIARAYARKGLDLVLTARREDRLIALARELEAAHGIRARTVAADLADPAAPERLVEAFLRDGLTIDVLVNNAGYGLPGSFRDTTWQQQRDFLQVMMTAPCELTYRLLPGMHARNHGRILNVASVAGLIPGAMSHSLYGGAKAFLIAFSQALHAECRGTGVHVTALCPGLTYSEFHDVNGSRAMARRLPGFLWLSAEKVAEDGCAAVEANQSLCVPGIQYKAITALVRLLPRGTAHKIAARARRGRREA